MSPSSCEGLSGRGRSEYLPSLFHKLHPHIILRQQKKEGNSHITDVFPLQLLCNTPNQITFPVSRACLAMVAADHQPPLSGTQVCGGAHPPPVIRHRGQTRARLDRLRHVPREGSTAPSTLLHPAPLRAPFSHHQMGAGSEF